MKNEIQKFEKQNHKLKRELLASEKTVKRLTRDNKWAGGMMFKMEKMLNDVQEELRKLKIKADKI
jgi:hypothetical protein